MGGRDDRVGGSGVNGRVDWWNNLVMGGGGRVRCEEDIGRGVERVWGGVWRGCGEGVGRVWGRCGEGVGRAEGGVGKMWGGLGEG